MENEPSAEKQSPVVEKSGDRKSGGSSSRARGAIPKKPKRKLPKPEAILFDVHNTITYSNFVTQILGPYFLQWHKGFLLEYFDEDPIVDLMQKLVHLSSTDASAPKIDMNGSREWAVANTSEYIHYCLKNNLASKPILLLRFYVWFDGLAKDKIQTPVYKDVAMQLKQWHSMNIKLCVMSNGWSEATRRFLSKTNQGDLTELIEEYFDTEIGPMEEAETFTQVIQIVGQPPEKILFLSKCLESVKAAMSVGISSLLMVTHRKNTDPNLEADIPSIRTFYDIEFIIE